MICSTNVHALVKLNTFDDMFVESVCLFLVEFSEFLPRPIWDFDSAVFQSSD